MASWTKVESPPLCFEHRNAEKKQSNNNKNNPAQMNEREISSAGNEKEFRDRTRNDRWKQWGPQAY